ncbi:hypothetical protein EMGR_007775 [Emarellia grisea]
MASPHAQTVINTIVRQIPTITAFTEIVYEDVAPEDGDLITRSLAESAVVEQHSARVKGTAEVWRRGVGGCGLTAHTKIIFPAPNPAPAPGTDIIEFSRQDLFGHHMRPGRSLTDVFPLDLEDLRDFARERLMVLMGLTPA